MDANTHILVFRLGGSGYGMPLDQVVRVVQSVECTPLPGVPKTVPGVIDLHGQIVPVLDIRERFGLAVREIGVDDNFIIAFISGRAVAIVVDRVDGVVKRSAHGGTSPPDEISLWVERIDGIASLEDALTLVTDLDQCLSEAEHQTLDRVLSEHSKTGK